MASEPSNDIPSTSDESPPVPEVPEDGDSEAKMAEVITLSDSDDEVPTVLCSTAPPTPAPRSPMVVKTDVNHGTARVHITHGAAISLENLSRKPSLEMNSRPSPLSRDTPRVHRGPISQQRMGVGPPMSLINRMAIQSVNQRFRPPPLPPGHLPAPSTSSRTRHQMSQNGGHKLRPYDGHYMFEAAETNEFAKRHRTAPKKFDGKFVCSYNPSKCFKLCDSTLDIINHVWSHVIHDPPTLPLPKKPVKGLFPLLNEGCGSILSDNSGQNLRKMQTCEYCNAVFKTVFSKHDHTLACHVHQDRTDTVCNICELDLRSGINLENHMKKHIPGEAPYNCSKCKYRTSVRAFFFQHYIDRHSNDVLMCPLCLHHEDLRPNARRSKHIFVRHFIDHMRFHATGPQYRCRSCALTFNEPKELVEHKARDHQPLDLLWQVRVRRAVHDKEREYMTKTTKITMLQKMYFETLEGKRVNDEVAVKGDDRMGYDTSLVGNTLFKCECGFTSYNGNRVASHYHRCRRTMKGVKLPCEELSTLHDPPKELELFAVYPPRTETETETQLLQAELERQLEVVSPDEAYILNTSEIEFQPIDDLLMLKMMANENDKSDQIIADCLANVVEGEE